MKRSVERTCRICGVTKHRSEFLVRTQDCLDCRARVKVCSICQETKPVEEFARSGRGFDGWSRMCKACHRSEMTTPAALAQSRKRRATERARRQRNAHLQRRYATDPEYAARQRALRRQSDRGRRGRMSVDRLIERDGDSCYLCDRRIGDLSAAEVDHVVPVAGGGTDHPVNLALTHRSCNRRKRDALIPDLAWCAPSAIDRHQIAVAAVAGVTCEIVTRLTRP